VLGGGGAVGTAYVAGALKALEEAGLVLDSAALMVGTSAGAIAAAQLRLGQGPEAVLAAADASPDPDAAGPAKHYAPAWSTRGEKYRRVIGAGGVITRSMLKVPLPMPSARVQKSFPPGLFRIRDQRRVEEMLPEAWVSKDLWLVAYDVAARRREALGRRPEHRQHSMRDAVLASCAVPGFYEPIMIGSRMYVDGGVSSTTNLDLAVKHGCQQIICIAPMPYQVPGRPTAGQRVLRRSAMRSLRIEMSQAGERNRDVLLIIPSVDDLAVHGRNILRGSGNAVVAERSYEQTHNLLRQPRAERFIFPATAV
jgi:NTE family protein